MSPGDICLMTSPGTNKFNRLAMVQEVMLDCAELGRRVWGPRGLSYHMGGNKRTNKPFTSLFKLKHMRMVDDIVKQEMMARLGYDARDPLYGARCVRPRKGKCSISAAELDAVIEELRERLRQPETRTERWMRDQRLRELDGELAKVVRWGPADALICLPGDICLVHREEARPAAQVQGRAQRGAQEAGGGPQAPDPPRALRQQRDAPGRSFPRPAGGSPCCRPRCAR
mmetsp:Transcript_28660/g.68357  ORF Transcript_28660/g.68357 Transcript_28660/m.68357 type:complete len:228 (+) Transcript_28660:610-1293(+)